MVKVLRQRQQENSNNGSIASSRRSRNTVRSSAPSKSVKESLSIKKYRSSGSQSQLVSLKSSLRSSSQRSTQYQGSPPTSADLEMGSKPSRMSDVSDPSPMITEKSGSTTDPSIVSWPKEYPIPFEVKARGVKAEIISSHVKGSRKYKTATSRSNKHLSNAVLDSVSEITRNSASTCSTKTRDENDQLKLKTNWGLPSDPRTLPVYLMPLAVLPLVCLVVLIMAGVLIGIVIESYFE